MLFTCGAIHAGVDSIFVKGNTYYNQLKYDSSVIMYQQLTNQGVVNSDVYYNLGNAFYKLKQFDSAKRYYQKSLKVYAGNKACQQNLALCRNKLNIRMGNGNAMLYKLGLTMNYFTINQLAISIYILVLILCIVIGLRMTKVAGKVVDTMFRFSKWGLVVLIFYVVTLSIFNGFVNWV